MATLSASGAAGKVTLTGVGHAPNSRVVVSVAFTATGRRFNEMRRVDTDGNGAIVTKDATGAVVGQGADVSVPFAGSVTAKAVNMSTGAVDATTGTATVT